MDQYLPGDRWRIPPLIWTGTMHRTGNIGLGVMAAYTFP